MTLETFLRTMQARGIVDFHLHSLQDQRGRIQVHLQSLWTKEHPYVIDYVIAGTEACCITDEALLHTQGEERTVHVYVINDLVTKAIAQIMDIRPPFPPVFVMAGDTPTTKRHYRLETGGADHKHIQPYYLFDHEEELTLPAPIPEEAYP